MTNDKKKCPYCSVERANLAEHIINHHPTIVEQLEERAPALPSITPHAIGLTQAPAPQATLKIGQDIGSMIREKLDLMLNIKIIEMLSKNPNTSLEDISKAINPPQKTTLEELKEYHDLVYGDEKGVPYVETGNQWVDIAQQALPIIKDLAASRKAPAPEREPNVRQDHKRISRPLERLQRETARGTGEPSSTERQHKGDSGTEQQNNSQPQDNS